MVVKSMAHLLYSESYLGALREFAPAITSESLALLKQGKPVGAFTRSIKMSLARSTPSIKKNIKNILKTLKPYLLNLVTPSKKYYQLILQK